MTLIEILVALAISSVIVGSMLTLVFEHLKVYNRDSSRVAVNQNLQGALLLIANDVRQAGERLTSTFPALEVVSSTSGSDEIVIRRSLIDTILPVCKDIKAGSNADSVFVAKNGASASLNCKDPSVDRIQPWKNYRNSQKSKTVDVLIYDPVTKASEIFTYDAEDGSDQHIHKSSGKWMNSYDADHSPMLFIIEERRYLVSGGNLNLKENRGALQPVAPDISALDVKVTTKQGELVTSKFPTADRDWKDIAKVDISLTGFAMAGREKTERTLSEAISVRNTMSVGN